MGFHHRRLITAYQPETVLLLRRFREVGGGVSASRANLIDDLIGGLKRSSVWAKLDAMYVYAQENSAAALINWKSPGTYNATLVNSPTFTTDRGFAGNGSNSYIDTNFNPTTASSPKYVQNSACRFGRILSPPSNDAVWGDASDFRNNFYVGPAASQIQMRINCSNIGTNLTATDAAAAGFWSGTRSASNAQELYKNGSSVTSNSTASNAMTSANFTVFRTENDYGASQQASHGFGQHLNSTEQAALAAAEAAYMVSVGAI